MNRRFWACLFDQNIIEPGFVTSMPHVNFVWGNANVAFLKKRPAALTQYHHFKPLQYSEAHTQVKELMPIVMKGIEPWHKKAVTYIGIGRVLKSVSKTLPRHAFN